MRVTTNRQLPPLLNTDLHHRRLGIHQILDSLDNLERILAMNLLPILKPLHHIIDKLLRHVLTQTHSIVVIVHADRIDIQALKRRRRVGHFNRFLEFQPSHEFLAVRQFQLRISVIRFPLDDRFEIAQRFAVV